ncbi:MAG: cation:proton antiporter [Deltaproteobacteria bacterium]|jgi:CPA2 family monovalent cation:H+ antiporter-2|nr:cation:proton antiporter [Deltaproteobacteria bacterium]
MEIIILQDIAIIFGLAIIVLQACHKIRLPAIIGFLVTGALVGPHGLHLVKSVHEVELLAEIGVVLLLFTIGLEFSLKDLFRLKRQVLIGGSLQVFLTIVVTAAIFTYGYDLQVNRAIFIGFLIALSSTAIVLRLYQERAELESLHGETVLAILIFQDFIVVLLMLLTPFLAITGSEDFTIGKSLLFLLLKTLTIFGAVLFAARYLVPHALFLVAKTRSRELFLLTIVAICLITAWLTSYVGLSLGLGAFLAGLVISESEYGTAALGNIIPFRDIFMSFFFVSIGMLLDLRVVMNHPGYISFLTIGVLFMKFFVILFIAILLGISLRSALMTAFALAQVGEFSFVLSKFGLEYNFLVGLRYQYFLAVAVITMAITPLLVSISPKLAELILHLPFPDKLKRGLAPIRQKKNDSRLKNIHNHIIIIGYGLNGQNLTKAAINSNIPYVIIETNPETVRKEKKQGKNIIYGDATHVPVLEHAGIKNARVAVIAISDYVATRHITHQIKEMNPSLHVIVRTRFVSEIEPLHELGADEIIPEEYETAVEIFIRVLNHYLVPQQEIDRFVNEVRAGSYQMLRSKPRSLVSVCDMSGCLFDSELKVYEVEQNSPFIEKTIAEIGLRKNFGVTILAIRRHDKINSNPSAETLLKAGDVLIIFGTSENLSKFMQISRSGNPT